MNKWDMRTHEVAYLLNPAFCGRILYSTIKTYNEILNKIKMGIRVYKLQNLVNIGVIDNISE